MLGKLVSQIRYLCLRLTVACVQALDLLLGFEWSFAENKTVGELMKPLLPRLGVVV